MKIDIFDVVVLLFICGVVVVFGLVIYSQHRTGGLDEPCNRDATCEMPLKCVQVTRGMDVAYRCVP